MCIDYHISLSCSVNDCTRGQAHVGAHRLGLPKSEGPRLMPDPEYGRRKGPRYNGSLLFARDGPVGPHMIAQGSFPSADAKYHIFSYTICVEF